jgi:hypothetical protein
LVQLSPLSLKKDDSAQGTLLLDAKAADFKVGAVLLIESVGLLKVTNVTPSGSDVLVGVTPAALTDAIQDGTLGWTRTFGQPANPDAGQAATTGTTTATAAMTSVGTASLRRVLTMSYQDGALSYDGTIGKFAVTFTLEPAGDGFDMKMSGEYDGDNGKVNVAGTGHLAGFTDEANITIVGGSVTDFTYFHDNLEGDFDLEIGGLAAKGEVALAIPARIPIPIATPIPMFVALGGQLGIEVSLSAQSTLTAKAHYHFKGSAGLAMRNGVATALGGLTEKELTLSKSSALCTITGGMETLMEFPRVELGIGVPWASAAAYFTMKNEVVANVEAVYSAAGLSPLFVGNCATVGVNLGGYVGMDAQVFGLVLAQREWPAFTVVNQKQKFGDECK